ncbi:hypothetical protein [Stenotrophomonas geniculata]|uniref:hypothetical protein n=1 Tax=Stenotrophomonas geniculata TaxID=86188 RepID=UPI003BF825A0
MTGWKFLPNPGLEEEGLGHAGIETFKGSPFPGVARECSQNSLDAAAKGQDQGSSTVHLVFRLLDVPAGEVPGLKDLASSVRACLSQAKSKKRKKETEFFTRAAVLVEQKTLPVLLVEDYGTTGLLGPAVEGSPFHALVKSSGVSQKNVADAGGSFGIGKNAAFAISNLRTVFYSTRYTDDQGKDCHLAQGKSILISHEDGEPLRSTGYWGNADYQPVDDIESLPQWLRRTETGTTVASIGFAQTDGWQWLIAESLARNFFSAVREGAIRFSVISPEEQIIEIDAATISDLFKNPLLRAAAENTGNSDDLAFSAAMLEALCSETSTVAEFESADAGKFTLTLLQQEGLPRRLGILRNGMYIADNLSHFGHAMRRFSLSRDFVAVLQPVDLETSARVRDMENPRHDEISADRIDDEKLRKKLKTSFKKLGAWVREYIRDTTTAAAEADILLDEMNQFFASTGGEQPIADPNSMDDNPERPTVRKKLKNHPPSVGQGDNGESGSSGGQKRGSKGSGATAGDRKGPGRGSVGGRGGRNIAYRDFRNSISDEGRARILSFTPEATAEAFIELMAVGVDSDEALVIVGLDDSQTSHSPRISAVEGTRMSIKIRLSRPYVGPISVVLRPTKDEQYAH